ncbi:MAG: chorismate mutase [Ignavibacteria bacterium]|jgi:chorismate mutase|nr:chorismate mutase [Ignavibacteria bacterium]MCU7504440.1 chorismate mutase [Ignavibacteria bacterium]MCU7517469.1 chorismate mutase [Ignavibacteria bacterium]
MLSINKYHDIERLSDEEKLSLLKKCRKRIDFFDRILVYILNKRTETAVLIGRVKISLGQPIYSPERERDVSEKINKSNKGPLSRESIDRIYERILDESRSTQKAESSRFNAK